MIKSLSCSCFAGLLLMGCANQDSVDTLSIFEPTIGQNRIDWEGDFDRQGCEQVNADFTSDQVAKCDLLASLLRFSEFKVTESDQLERDLGHLICNQVDLNSFSHSLRPRMEEAARSLNDVSNGRAVESAHACQWQTDELNFVLNAQFAVSDSKGGIESLYVMVIDEQLQGTYRDYQLLEFKLQGESWVATEQAQFERQKQY